MDTFIGFSKIEEYLVAIRRQIHQYPETGFDLERTIRLVTQELSSMGLQAKTSYGKSGIVTEILGRGKGIVTALRADMDALPLLEETNLPFCSKNTGKMHACGHDGHTAILLGAAKLLAANQDRFTGTVRLVFQPSEEGPLSGAKFMVDDGVMDGVDQIIAFHLTNELQTGTIGVNKGPVMAAASTFDIEIQGRGGHAAQPQTTIDTIALAAKVITEIQYIRSRQIDPTDPLVISIGSIHGGSASNIVAEKTSLSGTVRSYSLDLNASVVEKIEQGLKQIVESCGGSFVLTVYQGLPPLINHSGIVDKGTASFSEIVGEENVILLEKGKMGSEDFTYYNQKTPGAMFWLGSRSAEKGKTAELHNPEFDFDEDALTIGTQCFVQYVLDQQQ